MVFIIVRSYAGVEFEEFLWRCGGAAGRMLCVRPAILRYGIDADGRKCAR